MTETRHDNPAEPGLEAGNGHRSGAFLKGLVGGVLIGAAAGAVCAPHMYAALRRFRRQLLDLDDSPTTRYRDVTAQVGGAFDDLEQKARDVGEQAPSVVVPDASVVMPDARNVERETETLAGNTR
jgi:gas vesicle protein